LIDFSQKLKDHAVITVPEAGWAGFKNGELLRLAQAQFDVFVTVDRYPNYYEYWQALRKAK
jgi:hypothetical protein